MGAVRFAIAGVLAFMKGANVIEPEWEDEAVR